VAGAGENYFVSSCLVCKSYLAHTVRFIELGHQATGVVFPAIDIQCNLEQFLFPSVSEFFSMKQLGIRLFVFHRAVS